MTEHMITLYQLHAQKRKTQIIVMVSETKHFTNTFLKSETIEMIPESIVLL